MGEEEGEILQFAPFQNQVDEGFWHRLSSLKPNKLGIDDSPIPITGYYAPCSHAQLSNHLSLLSESLPPELSELATLQPSTSMSVEAFEIWDDIHSGKAVEDSTVLSRFLVISFADLKRWSFYYWFAFPALVLEPAATLINIKPALQWLSTVEAESLSTSCNEWRNSSLTADVPLFLVNIAPDSSVCIRHLKDWETCQGRGDKRYISVAPGWKDHRTVPNAVGWEFNMGKKGSKRVNLSKAMDPLRLAVSAADLNLKLMRWRALPSLDLSMLGSTKCLLLGAGTLGCQVSRMLLAWGFRKITLLDSGKVAVSNPLRQSLYTLDDYANGGEFKANAAVKHLKEIHPAVEAEGVVMPIPMPGHPVTTQEEDGVVNDCRSLHELINSHDVVFLLTDTRESRWLPTLLCAALCKVTITAALGFDSYMVMRHGAGPANAQSELSSVMSDNPPSNSEGTRLGCYFCNDVVAPVDGSMLMLIVENIRSGFCPTRLEVPFLSIRKSLWWAAARDVARLVLKQLLKNTTRGGMEFLLQAINHPTYLEDLTGLTDLMKSACSSQLDWDNEVDDEGEDVEI
ncbi:hypothetical protein MLD38_039927 [Melastoma candidum]|uniref:Uncharacterized protein n=1 Tax=Melastoma candidum TaxID=119954 RepID=A0ACB9L4E0_9MYRT|nr:hypothetical protein MLD38_039927 [Melastoma candidum]